MTSPLAADRSLVGASSRPARVRLWWEIGIVLALSLGASAVYAIVDIINSLTQPVALNQQSTTLNGSLDSREVFDLIFQLLEIAFALAPVALVCFLVWNRHRPHLARLGVDGRHPGRDVAVGFLIAACIGIPGLGLYLAAKALGLNVTVVASDLSSYWWTVPVLVLSALKSALQEELIVIGYLFDRLKRVGWKPWQILLGTSLLRGSYHLYQGFGGFLGNAIMGLVFGLFYRRYGRTTPLIVTHTILDVVSFAGYPLGAALFPALFAPAS